MIAELGWSELKGLIDEVSSQADGRPEGTPAPRRAQEQVEGKGQALLKAGRGVVGPSIKAPATGIGQMARHLGPIESDCAESETALKINTMRTLIVLLNWLACLSELSATTIVLTFVHQPLTTLGTDVDIEIVVTRVPVLMNSVPESLIQHVAAPNKLLQDKLTDIPDSNILSRLGITMSVRLVEKAHYAVTLDLSAVGDPATFGVTLEEVINATVDCINKTIQETNLFHGEGLKSTWNLDFTGDETLVSGLGRFKKRYAPLQETEETGVSGSEP